MARQKFKEWDPTPASLVRLDQIRGILAEYKKVDPKLKLTLRQMFYQLVSRDLIPNVQREYKNLGSLLSRARLAGLIDWRVIEDRGRRPAQHIEFESVKELIEWANEIYRLDRWEGQENYVELWCEKDALSSVLQPITEDLHTTLMVNRGYSSQSAMYDSARRFKAALANGQEPVLLYLGDFDPSGEDMVRDIRERMDMFEVNDLEVRKLALTPEQIRQYKPPPNPAKMTDSRAAGFVAKTGDTKSYEVDALRPEVLQQLLKDEIGEYLDWDLYEEVKAREEKHKEQLVELVDQVEE